MLPQLLILIAIYGFSLEPLIWEPMNGRKLRGLHVRSGGTIIKQVAGLHTLDPIALDVWNSGAGSLTYTLSENSDWMSLSQTSGSSSGGRQTIVLNFDTDELPVGTYAGEISIRSDEASNDPIEIGIIVDVFDDFDHFEIGTIPSPRPAGIPFPVNIYACNASNETVGLFNDSVGLSAMADCIVEGAHKSSRRYRVGRYV